MSASTLRPLGASAVLAGGIALAPAMGAAASPTPTPPVDDRVRALAGREAVPESASQHVGHGVALATHPAEPPVSLLLLLVPTLLGGTIGVEVTPAGAAGPLRRSPPGAWHRNRGFRKPILISRIATMTHGLFMTGRRRPTLGALYVAAVGAFTLLVLALVVSGLASPLAVVLVAVPLGPIGVVAAALSLPALTTPPSAALAVLVLAAALAVATINVMLAATASYVASTRLDEIRGHGLLR
ncbi:MAG: hypothetical protein HIU86_07415 [Acidobacteria bacterium]|nr:hypothetical protein [Acidobacteriota bacterium]